MYPYPIPNTFYGGRFLTPGGSVVLRNCSVCSESAPKVLRNCRANCYESNVQVLSNLRLHNGILSCCTVIQCILRTVLLYYIVYMLPLRTQDLLWCSESAPKVSACNQSDHSVGRFTSLLCHDNDNTIII